MQIPSRAQQGVWIIVRTVKTQPLLKITSGISERATLSEEEKGRRRGGGMENDPSSVASLTNAYGCDRARFHVFFKATDINLFPKSGTLTGHFTPMFISE